MPLTESSQRSPALLSIQSRQHQYSVLHFPDLAGALAFSQNPEKRFLLVDRRVHELYRKDFTGHEHGKLILVEATEDHKSYLAIAPLFETLIRAGFKRDCLLTVVGGGIVQDIGCFLASNLYRGLKWELIPTTLLAQGDSCIGSKSSINIGSFKNQLGSFYPPNRVLLSFDVLKTLGPDEIRSGLGEAIKLHFLESPLAVSRIEKHLLALGQTQPGSLDWQGILKTIVTDSLHLKKTYIEEDEFDRGVRNLLNFGHTFGHAYESATHYAIPHGIAVTLGMLTATWISTERNLIPRSHFDEVNRLLKPYYTPYEKELAQLTDRTLITAALKTDKKNTSGKVGCILTRGFGKMERMPLDLESELKRPLYAFLDWVRK